MPKMRHELPWIPHFQNSRGDTCLYLGLVVDPGAILCLGDLSKATSSFEPGRLLTREDVFIRCKDQVAQLSAEILVLEGPAQGSVGYD